MKNVIALTSTNLKHFTGLKLESKSHFYGRAAAEEVLASFYRALLRARIAPEEVLALLLNERGARGEWPWEWLEKASSAPGGQCTVERSQIGRVDACTARRTDRRRKFSHQERF